MKRKAESRTPTDELPNFLDETSTTTEPLATVEAEGDSPVEETEASDAETVAPGIDGFEDVEETVAAPPAPAPIPRRTGTSRRPAEKDQPRGGGLSIAIGAIALLGAAGLGFAPADATAATALERFGVTPATLVVLGTVLCATGSTRRKLANLHGRLDDSNLQNGDGNDALHESLQFLVAAHQASSDKPPAAGEELQHLLIAIQRQDEKINNLTKAIKMYGKPLMEIAGQGTELAASVAQVRTSVDTANESTRQALVRVESQVRTSSSWKQDLAALQDTVQQLGKSIAAIDVKPGAMPSFDPITQQLLRVEAGVQALGQRLDDSEVRKSLLRLEDTTHKAHVDVQKLLRGESVEKASTQLQERLDSATKRLNDGINQMREGNLGGIETAIRDIQREVSGVATAVSQIQAAVKSGAGRPAAAPTAAPAPASTPAPASAPAAGPASAPAPAAAADGYQTGSRTSNSKNVLGAIAKLKQMKN